MRDTLLLRARLQATLLGVPLTALTLGCSPPQTGQVAESSAAGGRPIADRPEPGKVVHPKNPGAAQGGEVAAAEAAPPTSRYPERWGMDPYDPEAEEEEGCVSGDWCGPLEIARKFANPSAGDEIGCPARLMHVADNGYKEGDKAIAGLSLDPMMQGRIRRLSTAQAREKAASDEVCCYHWYNYCSGRPLLDEAAPEGEAPRTRPPETASFAPVVASDAWQGDAAGDEAALAPALRERLADAWLTDARMEHASIAAFARATLELLAVGAPPELVAATQRAGLDEVEHARLCFALARRYSGRDRGPGPLPAVQPRALDLAGLATATFVEGCVGETIAALMATRAARRCEDPEVRAILERIAEDEAGHAALAWETVAWALRSGGEPVALALRGALAGLREGSAIDAATRDDDAALARHGRLDLEALASAREDAWREIIEPTLASLIG
ncbi:MAG: ferritin-like domain-containing protein [Myxococcales bacterium]|nr:ferritin-like domain-containing protein [Myxococcales bacterium]